MFAHRSTGSKYQAEEFLENLETCLGVFADRNPTEWDLDYKARVKIKPRKLIGLLTDLLALVKADTTEPHVEPTKKEKQASRLSRFQKLKDLETTLKSQGVDVEKLLREMK